MDIAKVREHAELKRLLAEKEAEVKALKKRIETSEAALLAEYADEGVQSMKVNDGDRDVSVYMQRDVFAKKENPDALFEALEASGHGDVIHRTVNGQTLNSIVREAEKAGEFPAEWDGVLTFSEKFRIGVRAA